jgi:hypothetical protein
VSKWWFVGPEHIVKFPRPWVEQLLFSGDSSIDESFSQFRWPLGRDQ